MRMKFTGLVLSRCTEPIAGMSQVHPNAVSDRIEGALRIVGSRPSPNSAAHRPNAGDNRAIGIARLTQVADRCSLSSQTKLRLIPENQKAAITDNFGFNDQPATTDSSR